MSISNFYEHILAKFPSVFAIFVLRVVNWLFQGMLHAARVEQIAKIAIDLILTSIFTTILLNFIPLKVGIIVAFILAHSFNWLFATNIWSARIKKYGKIPEDSKYFMAFLMSLQKSIQKQNSIYGAAIFGSISTGEFHKRSDVDVKLFRKLGFMNLIQSYLFLFFMRTKANFHLFPLDIYVVDNINNYVLKTNEVPVILHDPDKIVEEFYKEVKHFKVWDKKPYKICILSMKLFPVAGTSVRVLNFARSLVKHETKVHIAMFASKEYATSNKNERYDDIHIHTLVIDYPKLRVYVHPIYSIILSMNYLRWIKRLVDTYHFDIIQCTGPDMTFLGILIQKFLKKPIVADLHSCATFEEKSIFKKIFMKAKEKYVCKEANAVIVPTPELKNLYVSWGIDSKKVHVVRNVIDRTKFVPKRSKEEIRKKLNISMNKKVVIFHGNLRNNYNIQALDKLYEISEIMHKKVNSIKFLIVGSYNKKVDNENFVYTGYVDNLPDYINAADFAIIPIYMESLGIRSRLLEYLALSIPAITTPIGITGMVFVKEEGAVIVKDNIQEIVEVAIELIQNQDKLKQMKKNCEKVINMFNLELAARDLMLIYDEIA